MKFTWCLVALGLFAAAGCIPHPFLNKEDATEKVASPASQQPRKPRNFVAPDQVDERNYREKEKVLRQELEMEEQDARKAPGPQPSKQ